MSFFGFGPAGTVSVELRDTEHRRTVELTRDNRVERVPLYYGSETVAGVVHVKPDAGKALQHTAITVELLGTVEVFSERATPAAFVHKQRTLVGEGELRAATSLRFEFANVEKHYESYAGVNVRLRYVVRATVHARKAFSTLVGEREVWINNFQAAPEINSPIKMEVGIENCLHIEFEYDKQKYHMKDVVIGKIYFLLVRLNIRCMEVTLIRRESTGVGANVYSDNHTLSKFEIMDGCPVRGEQVPVRLFLAGFDLTPTYRNVHNKFSVKYYLNLVLVDDADRRYFKQQEIIVWRKPSQRKVDALKLKQQRSAEKEKEQQPQQQQPQSNGDSAERPTTAAAASPSTAATTAAAATTAVASSAAASSAAAAGDADGAPSSIGSSTKN